MEGDIDLVIFDLDGTLIDTAGEIAAATNDFLACYGWPTLSVDAVSRWIGRGTRALLAEAIADATGQSSAELADSEGFTDYVAAFDRYYDQHCGTSGELYPGVREVLDDLDRAGKKLAVVTNKEDRYTQRVLEAHRIADRFEPVISGDSLARKKPYPDGILACLALNRVTPQRSLFIGDSAIDAETGRNAGVRVWLLPHGYNMGLPVDEANADRIVQDFAEIHCALLASESERPGTSATGDAA
ncbi:MAG: HAD-IA family hydrolase [Woeseiaceae bacterium]|jgi:phosphoglycolate phosphatase